MIGWLILAGVIIFLIALAFIGYTGNEDRRRYRKYGHTEGLSEEEIDAIRTKQEIDARRMVDRLDPKRRRR